MKNILKRYMPSKNQIASIYSIQVLLVYSWVFVLFLYDLPRWILFLSPLEIFIVFAYSIVFAFLDSVLFFFILVPLSVLFYNKYLKEKYVPVLGSITLTSYFWIVFLRIVYQKEIRYSLIWVDDRFLVWIVLSMASILLIALAVYLNDKFQNFFLLFAEKSLVFLYLYLPISVICILVVFIRTIIN